MSIDGIEKTAYDESSFLKDDPKENKRRKKAEKKRRRYKFTDKKHPTLGIVSYILALLSLAGIVIAITISTVAEGQGGMLTGSLCALGFVFSAVGIVCAGITFKTDDYIFTFSWIGLLANIVIWLFTAVMFVVGL